MSTDLMESFLGIFVSWRATHSGCAQVDNMLPYAHKKPGGGPGNKTRGMHIRFQISDFRYGILAIHLVTS
jgi:hypothetical protein